MNRKKERKEKKRREKKRKRKGYINLFIIEGKEIS